MQLDATGHDWRAGNTPQFAAQLHRAERALAELERTRNVMQVLEEDAFVVLLVIVEIKC